MWKQTNEILNNWTSKVGSYILSMKKEKPTNGPTIRKKTESAPYQSNRALQLCGKNFYNFQSHTFRLFSYSPVSKNNFIYIYTYIIKGDRQEFRVEFLLAFSCSQVNCLQKFQILEDQFIKKRVIF